MTGKLFIGFILTFCIGVAVGYCLPQNENDPASGSDFELDAFESASEPEVEVSGPKSSDGNPQPNSSQNTAPQDRSPRGFKVERRQSRGETFSFIGFDAQGEESGPWPTAAIGDGAFLVPALALRAVLAGQIASTSGFRSRVINVRGLGERGAFAVLMADIATKPWLCREKTIDSGEPMWLLACSKRSSVPQPVRSGQRRFDQDLRLEFVQLEGQFDLPAGGIVIDDWDQLLGLTLPTDKKGKTRILEIAAFRLDRLRLLDMKLEEYFKVYFAGSLEALLKEARNHLSTLRFMRAIETFRIIADRSPAMRDTIHDEFLAAINGRLDELPIATNPRGRISFLRQAVRDFPGVGELWFELALVARKLREFEESIHAWEGAWKTNSNLVTDLIGSKNAVYFEWIMSHVDRDRVDDALQVIQIALTDTGGSSEIFLLQGKLLVRRRAYLAAADAMRDALQLDPSLGSSLDDAIARAERLAEGPGKVVIDYPPGARAIIASVRLNGKASGDFIVDTGATTSMVPVGLAKRAGLDTSDRVPKVRLQTAGNERIVPFSPVQSISLGQLSVNSISVVVGDISGKSGYGLLGMDFLGEFHIENDSENGRLVISTRN
ncbi:MAG: tetratricopeptide (TPR) repeat protein [Planctomycetota bacterium]|jgi:tetratricopeptide (TPR) repeat protein